MKNAIIVSKNTSTTKTIADILRDECGYAQIIPVSTGLDARTEISETDFELAVVCTPLDDEYGVELASDISHKGSTAVIILANSDKASDIQKKISSAGAFVLSRPLTKIMLVQAVNYVRVMRSEMIKLREANAELEKQLNETKIIDRAKCVLIQYLRITEEQAHKQIQKQAMDKRVKQIDVAKDILKTYEN